jgi:hypothetical protein
MVVSGQAPEILSHFNPDQTVSLPMDNFLAQNVICLKGKWATRRDVIKYIANIGSGVHSGRDKEDVHHLLNRVRRACRYSAPGGASPDQLAGVHFNLEALGEGDIPFIYTEADIDPVLVELLASAHFLAISPDIINLETVVKQELAS